MADYYGLEIIDVSDPANPVLVGGYDTSNDARGVAVAGTRIYIADGFLGLLVFDSLPNVQFTVRVDASTNVPFSIEVATNLVQPILWTPLLTTNLATLPFDFVAFDVRGHPQKFYRVHQPWGWQARTGVDFLFYLQGVLILTETIHTAFRAIARIPMKDT